MATITRTSDRDREQLRRSALTKTQGPSDQDMAGGGYPIQALLKALGDPQDPTNVSFPFLNRMRRDHMVAFGLHFIEMPAVKATYYFEADLAQVSAFADNLIRPIYGSLVLTLLRFLSFGYSPGAKNFDTINPSWVYINNGEVKKVWDNGNIDAVIFKPVIPLRPEVAAPSYDKNNGSFKGILYDSRYGSGSFIINGQNTPDIDLLHSVWAVHGQEQEHGSPYGFPRIAHCAPIFHMYRYIWTLLARAFENSADPGPVVRYPREDMPSIDSGGSTQENVKIALRIGTRRRSGSTIALPSDPYMDITERSTGQKKWDLEYPKAQTDFDALMNFLDYLEESKLRSIWLQEQGLIEGSGASSSRNVASEFGSKRDESQITLIRQIFDFIVDVFVKPALAMNMPWYEGKIEMKALSLGQDDEDIVRQVFQLMGQQGPSRFGIDVRRLAEARGFPMTSPNEFAAELKRAQDSAVNQQQQASGPPEVEPTQGRRALVRQSGFGENVYHQLGDEISLADVAANAVPDGDFVASLPKTEAFAQRPIVDAARFTRSLSQAFIAWAYRDFAIYLGKQKQTTLELEDGEDLLVGDKAKTVAAKIVRAWRPNADRVERFHTSLRRNLSQAFDRTARIHSDKLGGKVSATDKLAASWLEDQGARAVKSIMTTTREQLADYLADGVREGKTPREIAAGIRADFDEFPASRASTIARTEIPRAYNFATVHAGLAAGVKAGQLLDGTQDAACKRRNGRIVPLVDALDEDLNHPNCTFTVRLLPRAPANLEIRHEQLADGLQGRFDPESQTVLLSLDISDEDAAKYLLALGSSFL